LTADEARWMARRALNTSTLNAMRTHIDNEIASCARVGIRCLVNPLRTFSGPVSRCEEDQLWEQLWEDGFTVTHNHPLPPIDKHIETSTAIIW